MRVSRPALFWLYAATSVVLWLVVWLAGGEFASDGSAIRVGWEGAVLNVILVLPLWRRSVLAWHLLALEALITTVVFGSSYEETYGLLALFGLAQLLLLWRLRTPRERSAQAPSTY